MNVLVLTVQMCGSYSWGVWRYVACIQSDFCWWCSQINNNTVSFLL